MKKNITILLVILITLNTFGQSNNNSDRSQVITDFIINAYNKDESPKKIEFKKFIRKAIVDTENGPQKINVFDFPSYTVSPGYDESKNISLFSYLYDNKIQPNFEIRKEYFDSIAKSSVFNTTNFNRGHNAVVAKDSVRNEMFNSAYSKLKSNWAKDQANNLRKGYPDNFEAQKYLAELEEQSARLSKSFQGEAAKKTKTFIDGVKEKSRVSNNLNRIYDVALGKTNTNKYEYKDLEENSFSLNTNKPTLYKDKNGSIRPVSEHATGNLNIGQKTLLQLSRIMSFTNNSPVGLQLNFLQVVSSLTSKKGSQFADAISPTKWIEDIIYKGGMALEFDYNEGMYVEKDLKDIVNCQNVYKSMVGDRDKRSWVGVFLVGFYDIFMDMGSILPKVDNIVSGCMSDHLDPEKHAGLKNYCDWKNKDFNRALMLMNTAKLKSKDPIRVK